MGSTDIADLALCLVVSDSFVKLGPTGDANKVVERLGWRHVVVS